jgi:hypothetical protein
MPFSEAEFAKMQLLAVRLSGHPSKLANDVRNSSKLEEAAARARASWIQSLAGPGVTSATEETVSRGLE